MIRLVGERGHLRLPEPVQLASGDLSRDFIDAKRALQRGEDLKVACLAMVESVAGIEFDAVGGMTLGADQFAHVIAVLADKRWFTIRKAAKGRGTNRRIEGTELGTGDRVLLVEDVVTRGGSIREAYEVILGSGAEVAAAVALVDRGEAGKRWFEAQGVPYRALVTYEDLGIEPVGGGLISA